MHRWKVGLAPAKPAWKRRRGALVAERKARRRDRGVIGRLPQPERSARTAATPLAAGPALVVILLLSLGLWAMIWEALALAVSKFG